MIRSLSFASLFLVSVLGACATDDDPTQPGNDELAGEANDGDAAKADAAHDTFGYLEVKELDTQCSIGTPCQRYQLTRANRTSIKCADGTYQTSCIVGGFDWSAAGLSDAASSKIEQALDHQVENGGAGGVLVLVKGSFKTLVDATAFTPSEVWTAQLSNPKIYGTYVQVFDNHLQCITAPCPTFEEDKLNSTLTANTEGFAFTTNVSSTLRNQMYAAAHTTGVIVLGGRGTKAAGTGTELLRYTNQVYLPAK